MIHYRGKLRKRVSGRTEPLFLTGGTGSANLKTKMNIQKLLCLQMKQSLSKEGVDKDEKNTVAGPVLIDGLFPC